MSTRITIAIPGRCSTCQFKGDDFTDGTFQCQFDDEYYDNEKNDCEDWKHSDFNENEFD